MPVGVWRNPEFVKLWVGQSISAFGSRFTRDGLPLVAVISLGASALQTGLLLAASTAPVLLFALVAGVWVDRVRRRPILIATDLGRAGVLLVVPVGVWFGFLRVDLLLAVAAVAGVLTVFFDVAYRSYLPALVGREHLVDANSAVAASEAAAEVAGPALVGAVIQAITAPMAILVDALTFVFSAFAVGLIADDDRAPHRPDRSTVRHDIAEGLRIVARNPVLRTLAVAAATNMFFGGFYAALYALYAIRELHLGPAALGLAVAAGGAGDLGGALVAKRAMRRFGLGRTLIGTALVGGCAGLLTPLAKGPWAVALTMLAAGQFVGDLSRTAYTVHETTLRQSVVPDDVLGRVNASTMLMSMGMLPLGAVTAGILGGHLGARHTLLIAALGMLAGTLWLLSPSIRRLRSHQYLVSPAGGERGSPCAPGPGRAHPPSSRDC
jgi:Na+/melibiose symporter-like transporter